MADGQTSGLRQQLAAAEDKARRWESSENSMAKHQGETERQLNQERLRAAQLRDQVIKTETELTSSSWSEVGSQKPSVQRECQGPPQAAEQSAPAAEEVRGAQAEGEAHDANGQWQQGPHVKGSSPSQLRRTSVARTVHQDETRGMT